MSSLPATALETELRSLYERHAGRILGFCLRRLPSREEAEDAVQQTFLNAYRGLQRGTTPRSETAWLFKIAENVCRERRRAAWRRRRIETVHDPEGIARAAAPESEHDELAGLADALSELAPNQQRAILLREWQGLSYREIAAELGVTQAAVETLLFRARRSLAYKLDRTRARALGSLGSAAAWGKSLLGGAAAKVAATAGVFVAVTALTPALRQEIGGAFASTTRASRPAVTATATRPAAPSHPARARHRPALRRHPARRAKTASTGLRARATSQRGAHGRPGRPTPPPGNRCRRRPRSRSRPCRPCRPCRPVSVPSLPACRASPAVALAALARTVPVRRPACARTAASPQMALAAGADVGRSDDQVETRAAPQGMRQSTARRSTGRRRGAAATGRSRRRGRRFLRFRAANGAASAATKFPEVLARAPRPRAVAQTQPAPVHEYRRSALSHSPGRPARRRARCARCPARTPSGGKCAARHTSRSRSESLRLR